MNARVARGADQLLRKGFAEKSPPARALGLSGNNMRKMVSRSIFGDCLCNILPGNGNHCGAKPLCEAESLGDLISVGLACTCAGRCFDMDRGPLRAQAIGHAFGAAHDRIGAMRGIEQNKHALARRPRPFNAMRAHVVDHLGVDPLRRPAQRKLPQSR